MKTILFFLLLASITTFAQKANTTLTIASYSTSYYDKDMKLLSIKQEITAFSLSEKEVYNSTTKKAYEVVSAEYDMAKDNTFYILKDKSSFLYDFKKKTLYYADEKTGSRVFYRKCEVLKSN